MMQHFALKCGVYSREAFNQINAVFHKVNLVHIVLLEKLSGFECFFFTGEGSSEKNCCW